ncbi:SGNH/GDSL hydrolase family protein [Fictibacillus barbaricus]|uniref:Lysophospholipase L1-like esterase n=1 Tax=Fictibacillus barbaricus TaxID=182136 RepID=A0ABU1U1G5_9BACL|nr:SGNH/GDSL hydrolase family protein [Fictibacillus barbaricus]MDR7073320.1 lysophospholipase L1-like esterase [Fictibacillus barbaricus]
MNIVIVGNSVPLRVRPSVGEPFPILIEKQMSKKGLFVKCINQSQGATLISHGYRNIDNQIISHNPSVVILNYGINEACTRLLPKKLDDWLYIKSKTYLTINQFILAKCISLVRRILNLFRPFLIKSLKLGGWSTGPFFKRMLLIYINEIKKETNATCIILTIPNINDRVEKVLPGSKKRIKDFNQIIYDVAKLTNSLILEVNDLLPIDRVIPEGIHFSELGHKMIADELEKLIIKINN